MPARPSRRTVLAAAVILPAAAATGCSLSGPGGERAATRPDEEAAGRSEVDPDVALLAQVTVATEAMVRLYREVSRRHRGLRRELGPLLRAHRAHARALGDAAPPGGDVGAPRTGAVDEIPGGRRAALRTLRRAERRSADELLGLAGEARSGTFARLLASMAAASAQHVVVLDGVQA